MTISNLTPNDASPSDTLFQAAASQSAIAAAGPPLTSSQQLHQAYIYALNQLQAKAMPEQVEERIVVGGLARSTANALMKTLLATRRQADRVTGRNIMITGSLWIIGGLVITLGGLALARERGGSYYILWGAVIIGALQFIRGLNQFLRNAPARSTWDAQSEIDPLMVGNDYVWPMPKQNKSAWLGIIAFLGLIAVLSFTSLGPPLIDKSAAQLNLTAAELGDQFELVEETGLDAAAAKDLRDGNTRVFTQGDLNVVSKVIIGNNRWADDPADLLKIVEDSTSSAAPEWGEITPVNLGQRAALRSISVTTPAENRTGYLLAFIQKNAIVLLTETADASHVLSETVLSHARIIEGRVR
jgi:hypothetical protein